MLRLSNRARYAVCALYDLATPLATHLATPLAFGDAEVSRQVRDVARRQRIPVRFLEQIFQELKRAGRKSVV